MMMTTDDRRSEGRMMMFSYQVWLLKIEGKLYPHDVIGKYITPPFFKGNDTETHLS